MTPKPAPSVDVPPRIFISEYYVRKPHRLNERMDDEWCPEFEATETKNQEYVHISEITALKAENEKLKRNPTPKLATQMMLDVKRQCDEKIESLKAELAEARKDQDKYRLEGVYDVRAFFMHCEMRDIAQMITNYFNLDAKENSHKGEV